ncbi:(2Fe-2S) ferredoxin domain-containing protein, partial [Candidatus Bipolaricaulota bacterium]|nr:(2Fe-2S) ferredoxin domain-containing protein [Candidatus Bipolaricaulota bacterium]
MKINTIDDLNALKEEGDSSIRSGEIQVKVGLASCGKAAGGDKVYDALEDSLKESEKISVEKTGCLGFCAREPLVEVQYPEGNSLIYENVDPEMAAELSRKLQENKVLSTGILARRAGPGPDGDLAVEVEDLEG